MKRFTSIVLLILMVVSLAAEAANRGLTNTGAISAPNGHAAVGVIGHSTLSGGLVNSGLISA